MLDFNLGNEQKNEAKELDNKADASQQNIPTIAIEEVDEIPKGEVQASEHEQELSQENQENAEQPELGEEQSQDHANWFSKIRANIASTFTISPEAGIYRITATINGWINSVKGLFVGKKEAQVNQVEELQEEAVDNDTSYTARAKAFAMPYVNNLKDKFSNPEMRLPTLEEITNKATDIINAPSRHPVTLGVAAGALALVVGMPWIMTALAGLGVYGATKLRNHVYSQDAAYRLDDEDAPKAFEEGKKAAKSWTAYFNSCKDTNNWKNMITFGKGMHNNMDAQDNSARERARI